MGSNEEGAEETSFTATWRKAREKEGKKENMRKEERKETE